MNPEQIGLWAGFVLTLMIFSYVLGDNFLYRIAVYVFVGLAAGFITIVTVESVILPWLRGTLLAENAGVGNMLFGLIPLVIGVLFGITPYLLRIRNGAGLSLVSVLVIFMTGLLAPLVLSVDILCVPFLIIGFVLVDFFNRALRGPVNWLYVSRPVKPGSLTRNEGVPPIEAAIPPMANSRAI